MITGLNVTQQDTPALGVEAQIGDAFIPSDTGYPYPIWMDASENVSLATADGSNPRIDLIVAYVDLTVVSSTNSNNPSAWILDNITGTPAGSPSVPNNAAIEAVIGASNPYIILARVTVAAGATTITDANITDVRSMVYTKLNQVTHEVATSQTTTSDVYVDLATVGPTVNTIVGPSGKLLIIGGAAISSNTSNRGGAVSIVLTGANTLSASDSNRIVAHNLGNFIFEAGRSKVIEGLNPGPTTVKLQYKRTGGSGTTTFENRTLTVIPL